MGGGVLQRLVLIALVIFTGSCMDKDLQRLRIFVGRGEPSWDFATPGIMDIKRCEISARRLGWRGKRLEGDASVEKLTHGRGLAVLRGPFQHDLSVIGLEVVSLGLQGSNQPLAAFDPSIRSRKSIDLVFQIEDNRRRAAPRPSGFRHRLFPAVDFDRDHAG